MTETGVDTRVLETALRVVSAELDRLIGACLGPDGKPQAPTRQALMRARSMLPPGHGLALTRKAKP